MYILIIILRLLFSFSKKVNDKLIISLSSNPKNINNIENVVNSILEQNVDHSLYKIILILSKLDFNNKNEIPTNIKLLEQSHKLRILLINNNINSQSRLIFAIKKYPNNPILLISDNIIFPYGWLEMFINDHKKYPNDAISASIQYYFGKNLEIREFIEGFKGEKFGIFNQAYDMIFNFALINTNLGGTLYPKNFFKNNSFFDLNLFLKISYDSDEFWQSCFIMIENKTLRQSSKIYDYTKHLINESNNSIDKKILLEKIKTSFLNYFPEFKTIVFKRQHKIIVSFTSYTKRFHLLPRLIECLKRQTLLINEIVLFLTEEDNKNYNLNISEFKIITVKENLRPHLKYFYAMQLFRDYAIINIDDDINYSPNTFETLYNNYLDYPNIIVGRRSHYFNYRINGELKKYNEWIYKQKKITEPDFNTFLTGVGSILYPPDILNINEHFKYLVNELITNDDLVLKYFSIRKGIVSKWIENNELAGKGFFINGQQGNPLCIINGVNNDIIIKKINLEINHTVVNNLCIPYRNINSGITIYLLNINNITILNAQTLFIVNAYSYCFVDESMKFDINFGNLTSKCKFEYSNDLNINKYINNNLIATCSINESNINFEDYYFPKAHSDNGINIKISNYRKNLKIIFKDFYCIESNNCILKAFFYQNLIKNYEIELKINNGEYICKNKKEIIYANNGNFFPIEENLNCVKNLKKENKRIYISGIPNKFWASEGNIYNVTNLFIVMRIIIDDETPNQIIIIGKFINNLQNDLNSISINILYPNLNLHCNIKSISKNIISQIYCPNDKIINSEIIIENQIAYTEIKNESILLINEETFIEIYFNGIDFFKLLNNFNDINIINAFKKEYISYYDFLNIIVFIIIFGKKFFSWYQKKIKKEKKKKKKSSN